MSMKDTTSKAPSGHTSKERILINSESKQEKVLGQDEDGDDDDKQNEDAEVLSFTRKQVVPRQTQSAYALNRGVRAKATGD